MIAGSAVCVRTEGISGSGLQSLNLPMNHASLPGFAFFQCQADLFRPDSCGFSLDLCHYLSIQNAACETHLDPNSKLHQ